MLDGPEAIPARPPQLGNKAGLGTEHDVSASAIAEFLRSLPDDDAGSAKRRADRAVAVIHRHGLLAIASDCQTSIPYADRQTVEDAATVLRLMGRNVVSAPMPDETGAAAARGSLCLYFLSTLAMDRPS
jgi:hypothetical protein